jgi:low affinity Fe/Cu permease
MSAHKHRPHHHNRHETFFARLARWATDWSGSTFAFFVAVAIILIWLASGPFFGYSDTWQLVINTGTTIVTFLMVFLIQRTQNKDSRAVHLKLNELVAAVNGASNRLINAENLTEEELQILHAHYGKLVELARSEGHITDCHSVEEAVTRHKHKKRSGPDGRQTVTA